MCETFSAVALCVRLASIVSMVGSQAISEFNVKLSDNNRRAIDLMLDRGTAASGANQSPFSRDGMSAASGYVSHTTPADQESVQAVQRVLDLLSLLPNEEPPTDLVERTMARIEQSVSPAAAAQMPFRLGVDPTIPHA